MQSKQNECKHSVCACEYERKYRQFSHPSKEARWKKKNAHPTKPTLLKKKLINRTTVFASLNRFLHNSHFKLSLKTSKSTSISSRPGLVDAFWPRRRRFVVVVVVVVLVVLVVLVVAVAVVVVVVLTSIFFVLVYLVVVCVCVVVSAPFFFVFFSKT